jgi:hypothetical protein
MSITIDYTFPYFVRGKIGRIEATITLREQKQRRFDSIHLSQLTAKKARPSTLAFSVIDSTPQRIRQPTNYNK